MVTRNPSKAWGIYRNVPFLLLGLTVLFLYKISPNGEFNLMWVAIMISFLFYMPVVTFGDEYPKLGMFLIPKTCAYIWMVVMGLSLIG